jgi:RNA polymerase sigma-70 factor (ECF subfamily)
MNEVAATGHESVGARLDEYRAELTGYCYRMLGSVFEAQDAVQETMVRAWRSFQNFEGRSSLRSWIYRIATNVCLDLLAAGRRRALPLDLSAPTSGATSPGPVMDRELWIEPFPGHPASAGGDPAEASVWDDSVRLAFVAALQHLPPKQRATLLLRDVLCFSAREVAELHDSTVASVNSALQRARATLAARRTASGDTGAPAPDAVQRVLADRYARAFSRFDMEELGMLLHVDATLSLPPYALWMRGVSDIQAWLSGPAIGCRGSRLIPTVAGGSPAFGQYRPNADGTGYTPWALQVVEIGNGRTKGVDAFRVTGISAFRDTDRLFPLFGLPSHVPA